MNNEESSSSGLGILEVLQIIFIVLKLCSLIDWSWPVVLIPLWIILTIFVVLVVLVVLMTVLKD